MANRLDSNAIWNGLSFENPVLLNHPTAGWSPVGEGQSMVIALILHFKHREIYVPNFEGIPNGLWNDQDWRDHGTISRRHIVIGRWNSIQRSCLWGQKLKVGEATNTAMSGYQEALTDPSYAEQILVMTYPHIGNTGVNSEDVESDRLWVHGFVAKRFQDTPSNHRSTQSLEDYLIANEIPFLHGIDTRSLVRHLRDKGP